MRVGSARAGHGSGGAMLYLSLRDCSSVGLLTGLCCTGSGTNTFLFRYFIFLINNRYDNSPSYHKNLVLHVTCLVLFDK